MGRSNGQMSIHIRLEFINGKPKAFLDKDLHAGGWLVPAGFETDFASIPRIFWNILPPIGSYAQAAVVHDYLYQTRKISRKEADLTFLLLMKSDGVNFLIRTIMYWAVRLFGGSHYYKCQCKI